MKNIFQKTALAITLANSLPVQAEPLPEVVVTATRQAARVDEVLSDVTVIDRQAIEMAGGDSVIELLARQPGIQMMQNGGVGTSAQLYVRGARSDQTKILLDGMPINSIDIQGSPLRYLPLADVERIEILRGPASALYGADAIGGVIQIITRRAQAGLGGDAYLGAGSNGALKRSLGIRGGDERWRFSLSGNDFRTDGISALRNGPKLDADKDPFRQMGFRGNLVFAPAQGHELGAQWMSNHGQVFTDSATGSGSFNARTDFSNEVWNVASKNTLSDRWTSTLRYGQSLDNQTSYSTATSVSTTRTLDTQLSWQNDVKLGLGSGLILLERQDRHVGPAVRFPGNKVDTHNDAVVLGWNASLGAHHWQWASRRDDHSVFGAHNTWSGNYGYQLAPSWRVNGSLGTSFKAPTPYQLYATTSVTPQLIANPGLQPEEGRNRELALAWDNGVQNASVLWYRNDISNLIEYHYLSTTTGQYQNISKAKLEGWTLAWSGRVEEWRLGASLDLLDAKDETTHKMLERRAKEKLNFNASRRWAGWDWGGEIVMVGRRYSPSSATFTSPGNSEAYPMGAYSLLNLTARTDFSRDMALEIRLNNIGDKRYTTALTSSGKFEYNAPGMTWFVALRYKM